MMKSLDATVLLTGCIALLFGLEIFNLVAHYRVLCCNTLKYDVLLSSPYRLYFKTFGILPVIAVAALALLYGNGIIPRTIMWLFTISVLIHTPMYLYYVKKNSIHDTMIWSSLECKEKDRVKFFWLMFDIGVHLLACIVSASLLFG